MLHELIYDQLSGIIDNVFPGIVAESKTLPYINHFEVSMDPSPDGDSEGSKLDQIRYQVSCFHTSYADVTTLADAVRDALDEYSGSGHDVTVARIRFMNRNYIYEGNRVHHMALDFNIRMKL